MKVKLFSWFWKKWLYDGFTGKYSQVIKIKGWRTALIEPPWITLYQQHLSLNGHWNIGRGRRKTNGRKSP